MSKQKNPIAIDAAGGDKPYDAQVEGAVVAFKEFGTKSALVGKEDLIRAKLEALGAKDLGIEVFNATEEIGMDESPTRSIRKKPDSSLCVAYNLVKDGKASSVISAGNSGAMMAAGRFIWGALPGIERPAIASLIPKAGEGDVKPNVILDMGANVDCHAHHLVQFAIMGSIYHETLLKSTKPKVALLSNGEELSKGTDVTRAAAQLLKDMDFVNFIGYVEGRDIVTGAADVIVCDGFVGNVALKTMEGIARVIGEQLKIEGSKGPLRKLGMLLSRGILKAVFKKKFDYTSYGGCPLLGLPKLSLVLHGSSGVRSVKNALKVAAKFDELGMTQKIADAIGQFEETDEDVEVAEDIGSQFRSGSLNLIKKSKLDS